MTIREHISMSQLIRYTAVLQIITNILALNYTFSVISRDSSNGYYKGKLTKSANDGWISVPIRGIIIDDNISFGDYLIRTKEQPLG